MTTSLVVEHDTTPAEQSAEPGAAPVNTTNEQIVYPYIERGVDPRDLRAEDNSREVGDIRQTRPELVALVAKHGLNTMVSMVSVAPDPDGGLRVLVGFHRTAAAVAVKEQENPALLVDVLVHAPGTTREQILLAHGIENIHRVGYTQAEEAGYYEQLAIAGLDDETIAEELKRPIERVRAGRVVAASSRTRAASTALPEIDLLAMAHLAEFADDEADHQTLVEVLADRPRDLESTIRRLRRQRDRRAAGAQATQQLTEQGYALIEDEYDLPEGVERLDELCTGEDTEPLDPAGHAGCPGRAAFVWVAPGLEVRVTEFCVDYAAHGHRTITSVTVAATEARLRADGVPLADPAAEGAADLDDLCADEKAEHTLSAADHATCPGHAAYVQADSHEPVVTVSYLCTDYAAHGHVLHTATPVRPEHDADWKAGEIKRAGKNNKAWLVAKADRREWLRLHFKSWRKRASESTAKGKNKQQDDKLPLLPDRAQHWLALAPVLARDFLTDAAPAHRYAATLLGLAEPDSNERDRHPITVLLRRKTTTEAQSVAVHLAMVIGACEEHWDRDYTKNADASWRRPSQDARYYFALLESLGYPLSDVERLINNPELDVAHWPHLATTVDSAPADLAA